jgi:hypothetical protein
LLSFNSTYDNVTFTCPALQDVQKTYDNDGVGDKIRATAGLNADVHESSSNKPSDGSFWNNIKDITIHIVKRQNIASFVVNYISIPLSLSKPRLPI